MKYSFKTLLLSVAMLLLAVGLQAQMPAFSFQGTDGKLLSPDKMDQNKPTVVFFFDPDCDHCQEQAGKIKPQLAKFKNANLLFVSWGEMDAIKRFQQERIGSGSNIYFAKDVNYAIDSYFGDSQIPTVHIFAANGKKLHTFTEVVDPAEILKYIQ